MSARVKSVDDRHNDSLSRDDLLKYIKESLDRRKESPPSYSARAGEMYERAKYSRELRDRVRAM